MRNALLIIAILFTGVGYGNDLTGGTSAPIYQSISQTKENHFSERESQERSYIDTTDEDQRTTSKPEKKRKSVGGTFLRVICVVFLAVGIYLGSGDWDGLI
jgi:hypothetical protein